MFYFHKKILYHFSSMLLFWTIFDGIICFFTPIYITQLGYTKTQMGLLIASSNLFGAIFDFLLSKYLKNTHYRRLFLILFIICFIYPTLLWSFKNIFLFLIAMAFWGLYGDLQNFATFDFISENSKKDESCQHFAIIGIFRTIGYFIGPIIAGYLLVSSIDSLPLIFSLIFLSASFLIYLALVIFSPKDSRTSFQTHRKSNFFREIFLWKNIGKILLPVLIFNTALFTFDGIFWALVPLFSQVFTDFKDFNGILMGVYMLPSILVGLYVGRLTKKNGKKKTAYISFLMANIFILFMGFLKTPFSILGVVFLSSLLGSLAWPAIRGAYADYISESNVYEKEIEGLNDFTTNLGYIFGPIIGGILSDRFGLTYSFTLLGIFNIALVLVLFLVTPRKINVVVHRQQ